VVAAGMRRRAAGVVGSIGSGRVTVVGQVGNGTVEGVAVVVGSAAVAAVAAVAVVADAVAVDGGGGGGGGCCWPSRRKPHCCDGVGTRHGRRLGLVRSFEVEDASPASMFVETRDDLWCTGESLCPPKQRQEDG
jgi:hypothetical protein